MKKKYKIIYDREGCIGAATCTIFSDKFKIVSDGKADLIGSKQDDNEMFILEIDEDDFEEVLESARSCPVNVIHIYELETNKKII